MKKYSLLVASIMMLVFVASCGKYEEGPAISLRSKKARLVNKWQLEKSYKNGQEQTLTEDDKKSYMEIKDDNTVDLAGYVYDQMMIISGTWSEIDNYSKIRLTFSGTVSGIPYTFEEEYTILRLKNDELWVKYVDDDNNDEYEDHYVTYKE